MSARGDHIPTDALLRTLANDAAEASSEYWSVASRAPDGGTADVYSPTLRGLLRKIVHVAEAPLAVFGRYIAAMQPATARALLDRLERLAKACDVFEQALKCDACDGTGKPISGLPCGCRGTGSLAEMLVTVRVELVEARQEIEWLRAGSPQPGDEVVDRVARAIREEDPRSDDGTDSSDPTEMFRYRLMAVAALRAVRGAK